jgi:hypothetical protein
VAESEHVVSSSLITQSPPQSQAQAQSVPYVQSQNSSRTDQNNSNQARNQTLSHGQSSSRGGTRQQCRASLKNESYVPEQHREEDKSDDDNDNDALDSKEFTASAKVPMGWADPSLRGGRMLDVRSVPFIFTFLLLYYS